MFKKILCIVIALVILLSVASVAGFSASAYELKVKTTSTNDESTTDEADLLVSEEPKADISTVKGLVIGYMGDSNLDDKINVKDSTAIQKHIAKREFLTEKSKALADTNYDSKLNIKDATAIQKYIAGVKVKSVIWHVLYETGTHIHNYGETVYAATCEQDGYTRFSCICGEEYTDDVTKAIGHEYKTEIVAPTCIDYGYNLHKCIYCQDSYNDNLVKPTGEHQYVNYICKVCNTKLPEYPFKTLKRHIIKEGEFDDNARSHYLVLDTGYQGDLCFLLYNELEDAIGIAYTLYYDNTFDMVTIFFQSKSENFNFYMLCPGLFESAGILEMSNYTTDTFTSDVEYYAHNEQVLKMEAVAYTFDFIDAALAIYCENQDTLPVTLRELGFENFAIK